MPIVKFWGEVDEDVVLEEGWLELEIRRREDMRHKLECFEM